MHLSDFVAGVPKGVMLFGLVRKPHHHSNFERRLILKGRAIGLGGEIEPEITKVAVAVFSESRSDEYHITGLLYTYSMLDLRYFDHMFCVCVCAPQVSVLNGTDLKSMLDYTGEQVSIQTSPALTH